MLVMFSVGIANLAWMPPFTLLMLYEKAGRSSVLSRLAHRIRSRAR